MGKIIYLMGKSSSGKDTIYKRIMEAEKGKLQTIVPYTTRPIRAGETDGVEYHFTSEAQYEALLQQGKVVEVRDYNTFHGLWRYYTVLDAESTEGSQNYIMIGTLESFRGVIEYLGAEKLIPVLIDLDDGIRLQRALDRERRQEEPKYEEMCRRFLADSKDFSEENIRKAGITRRFQNDELEKCLSEILEYIDIKIRQE